MANDILNHPNFVKKNLCNSFSDRTVQRFYKFNTSLVVSVFSNLILLLRVLRLGWVSFGGNPSPCQAQQLGLGASLVWGLDSSPLQTQTRLHKRSPLTSRGYGCEPWPSVLLPAGSQPAAGREGHFAVPG